MLKADSLQNYKLLSKFYFFTHSFFQENSFDYLKTPSLVICPGTEPALEVFATQLKLESKSQNLFLATSPEIHLKKALMAGFRNIYEITTSFRNGEITDRHQPEFQILEWYRAHSDLQKIQQDLIDLIEYLHQKLSNFHLPLKKPKQIRRISIAELFQIHLNFMLTPETDFNALAHLCEQKNYRIHPCDQIDDLFFWLMNTQIEPHLNPDELTFVELYPPYQAALATLTKSGWANRFEAYWQGYELCNAFQELNDESTQRARALADLEKKKKLGKTPITLDEEFLANISLLPPAAGVALGLERLFMSLTGLREISQCTLFPHKIESLQKN